MTEEQDEWERRSSNRTFTFSPGRLNTGNSAIKECLSIASWRHHSRNLFMLTNHWITGQNICEPIMPKRNRTNWLEGDWNGNERVLAIQATFHIQTLYWPLWSRKNDEALGFPHRWFMSPLQVPRWNSTTCDSLSPPISFKTLAGTIWLTTNLDESSETKGDIIASIVRNLKN